MIARYALWGALGGLVGSGLVTLLINLVRRGRAIPPLVLALALVVTSGAAQARLAFPDTAVVRELREWWHHRMDLAQAQKVLCVRGHYVDDSTFALDELRAARRCRYPNFQGALAVEELQVTSTYEQSAAAWRLALSDQPGWAFIGALVGVNDLKQPIIWDIIRRQR